MTHNQLTLMFVLDSLRAIENGKNYSVEDEVVARKELAFTLREIANKIACDQGCA